MEPEDAPHGEEASSVAGVAGPAGGHSEDSYRPALPARAGGCGVEPAPDCTETGAEAHPCGETPFCRASSRMTAALDSIEHEHSVLLAECRQLQTPSNEPGWDTGGSAKGYGGMGRRTHERG